MDKSTVEQNVPEDERLSVAWTLNQIRLEEAQRLADKVRTINPDWQYGEPFDTSILN